MVITDLTRRTALKRMVFGGLALSITPASLSMAREKAQLPALSGSLACRNTHTGDAIEVRYLEPSGEFNPAGVSALDKVFRCHYTDDVHRIDRNLYLLLDAIRCQLGNCDQPYQLISGYRSPAYNRLLRSRSVNVAKRSYHLRGMAADVRLDGVPVAALKATAIKLRTGGVGSYADFVHVDVGPVRYW